MPLNPIFFLISLFLFSRLKFGELVNSAWIGTQWIQMIDLKILSAEHAEAYQAILAGKVVAPSAPLNNLVALYANLILSFNNRRFWYCHDILRLYGFLASLIRMLCEIAQSTLLEFAEWAGNHSWGSIKKERIVLSAMKARDLGVVFLILQVPEPDQEGLKIWWNQLWYLIFNYKMRA